MKQLFTASKNALMLLALLCAMSVAPVVARATPPVVTYSYYIDSDFWSGGTEYMYTTWHLGGLAALREYLCPITMWLFDGSYFYPQYGGRITYQLTCVYDYAEDANHVRFTANGHDVKPSTVDPNAPDHYDGNAGTFDFTWGDSSDDKDSQELSIPLYSSQWSSTWASVLSQGWMAAKFVYYHYDVECDVVSQPGWPFGDTVLQIDTQHFGQLVDVIP